MLNSAKVLLVVVVMMVGGCVLQKSEDAKNPAISTDPNLPNDLFGVYGEPLVIPQPRPRYPESSVPYNSTGARLASPPVNSEAI
jgi:hypothetical protein